MSEGEVAALIEKAARCFEMMESEDPPWEAGKETTAKVREALKDVRECLGSFGYSLKE